MASTAPHSETLTSVKALTDLPVELMQEIIGHVNIADLPALCFTNRCLRAETQTFFRKAFFTKRRHEVTHKSLTALHDITRHEVFRDDLNSIIFKSVSHVDLEPEHEKIILGVFRNLHTRGIRFSVGVDAAVGKWERRSSKFLARFIGSILALSASTQCLTKIFVMLPEDFHLKDVWDDHRNDAICAHLAIGTDLEILWCDIFDSSACYKSEDHSLMFMDMKGIDGINDMFGHISGCIDEAVIEPLEKVHIEGCNTDPEDLMGWLEIFPEIKELSVVDSQFISLHKNDSEWHYVLAAVMEMENLEVLVLQGNTWWPEARPALGTWDYVSTNTELSLRGKQNIREGLQGKITELKAAAN
ncbi:hypothetical protein BDV97DRAFT_88153 [Delphinella strobiligena]|nr:hypothetical protein BDV97DRAFT_88153 [Delphinella strobiligena]